MGWHRGATVCAVAAGAAWAQAGVTDPGPVDLTTRESSRTWFLTWWPKGHGAELGFTGDVDAGLAGDTSQEWKDQQCLRINTYRRLAGLQPVTFKPEYNRAAQLAALLCAANGESNHTPPPTWRYWSEEGRDACGNCLLGPNVDYENPLAGYIADGGDKNLGLGHRLTLLDAPMKYMGTGDVPKNNSTVGSAAGWSFSAIYSNDPSWGDHVPSGTPPLVLWPAQGYVPHCLIPTKWVAKIPDDATSAELTFASASVSVSRNGVDLPVWILPLNAGIGLTFSLDGTKTGGVGWTKDGQVILPPQAGTPIGNETVGGFAVEENDVTYRVTLTGIRVRATGDLWRGDGRYEYQVIGYNHNRGPALQGAARLVNVSTRSYVGTGASIQIGGFVVAGSRAKKVLLRASGPALGAFGVAGTLANPQLSLLKGTASVAENGDWGQSTTLTGLGEIMQTVGAFAWEPGSSDAALVATVEPGATYTAHVSGAGGQEGVGLVEIYDAEPGETDSQLINLSSRTFVGSGERVQIAGFVLRGEQARTVLIRVTGPGLAAFGVERPLPKPHLVLFNGGTYIRRNQGWGSFAHEQDGIEARAAEVGAFSWQRGSNDAALVATLLPNKAYSAVVTDDSGAEGNALIEVYSVP